MRLQHRQFVSRRRISHAHLYQKAIQLRFGQRIRAFKLHRVLRRDDSETLTEIVTCAINRDLPFLHRFQQRRLRLGRRTIDLVRQQHIGEQWSGAEFKAPVATAQHRCAGDVSRHQIGRELYATKAHSAGAGGDADEQRFRDAGHAFEQHMSAGQQRRQQFVDGEILPDNAASDCGAQRGDGVGRRERQIRRRHVRNESRSWSEALGINVRCCGTQRRKVSGCRR